MVVPTGKRTRPAQTASHFLFLHLYLRLRGTKVSPPCCSPADLRSGRLLFPELSDCAHGCVGRKVLFCV